MNELTGFRVCMATSSHLADDDRIFFKESRTLVRSGAEVVLLCAQNQKPPARTDGVQFVNYAGGGSKRARLGGIGRLCGGTAGERYLFPPAA